MKVLMVQPKAPIYGGAEVVIDRLSEYMTSRDIGNHTVCCNSNGKVGSFYQLWRETHQAMDNHDLINVHNFPAPLAAIPTRKPIVWMCNEPPELFTNLVRKFPELINRQVVKRLIKNVVVADKANARRFWEIYGIIPKVIPYGIDWDFFSQGTDKAHWEFAILQVGTLSELKNQLASIDALRELTEYVPHARLVLVGYDQGRYAKSLKVLTALDGQNVTYTGDVTREQVREWYYRSDVVIHPVGAQGGWLTPFEAMAAGKTVIVSREFTASHMVREHGLGIVTDNLAHALHNVFLCPSLYKEQAMKAREWVRDNLPWENYCRQMVDYFGEVILEGD